MKRIVENMGILQYLNNLSAKDQKNLISGAPKSLLVCLSEIALNVCLKQLPLTLNQVKKLKKFEKQILFLSKKKHSLEKRKKLLKGGSFLSSFLSTLLPPLTISALRKPTEVHRKNGRSKK